MAFIMGWDPLERFLVGLAIATMLYCSILYLNKAIKREDPNEKIVLYGFAGLFFFFSIGRFLYFLAHLFHDGEFTNGIFYFNTDLSNIYIETINTLGTVSILFSLFLIIFGIEFVSKRSHYLFSLLQIVFIIVIIFVPYSLSTTLANMFITINAIIFVTILLVFTKWASYEFRAISAIILFGYWLMLLGAVFSAPEFIELGVVPLSVSPLFFIGGSLIWISPMLIDPKHFSRASRYWLIVGIFIIAFSSLMIISSIIFGITFYMIVLFLTFELVLLISLYQAIKLMNKGKALEEEILPDFLSALTRRQNLTEEEVSISKERKICLVCKSKLSKQIFLCSECGALYCIKCSETLSNSENACWACETPFNELKPSKPFKLEQQELKTESSRIIQPKEEKNQKKA